MESNKNPRLRNVDKVNPPYKLNKFPSDFGLKLGREIIYLLATKGSPSLEGSEWEQIFANCIGAAWKPSNVGLDDVVLDNCAWGAKTIKSASPESQKSIRLISGRNSPVYSFGESKITEVNPDILGEQVLSIWNERVSAVRKVFKFVRTIVLMKSNLLSEVAVFEFETVRFDPELYTWSWNERNNLEGFKKGSQEHIFTWQPHGSQFTIIEKVPDDVLLVKMKAPHHIDKESVLDAIGFNENWIEVSKRGNL